MGFIQGVYRGHALFIECGVYRVYKAGVYRWFKRKGAEAYLPNASESKPYRSDLPMKCTHLQTQRPEALNFLSHCCPLQRGTLQVLYLAK